MKTTIATVGGLAGGVAATIIGTQALSTWRDNLSINQQATANRAYLLHHPYPNDIMTQTFGFPTNNVPHHTLVMNGVICVSAFSVAAILLITSVVGGVKLMQNARDTGWFASREAASAMQHVATGASWFLGALFGTLLYHTTADHMWSDNVSRMWVVGTLVLAFGAGWLGEVGRDATAHRSAQTPAEAN